MTELRVTFAGAFFGIEGGRGVGKSSDRRYREEDGGEKGTQ